MNSLPKEFPHEEELHARLSAAQAEQEAASEAHEVSAEPEPERRDAAREVQAENGTQETWFQNEPASGLEPVAANEIQNEGDARNDSLAPQAIAAELVLTDPMAVEPAASGGHGRTLFESLSHPEVYFAPRVPHFGHVLVLGILFGIGWLMAGLAALVVVQAHLFGIGTLEQASTDIRFTLASEAIIDIVALAGCLVIFPRLWHRGFFNGISWRRSRARRRSPRLVGAAFLCFVLALVNARLMPGPADAPIDRVFRAPGAAWLLFAFAITFAPFFEEIAFRGFLLPAMCTACDWIAEKLFDTPRRFLDAEGQPQWSLPAMICGSVLTSIPFAGMHAAQTAYSLGPFVLLVSVSLVLCWARLGARSLSAAVLVHASYNFMLFALMFIDTGGFKHLDNM